ncbi:hypothetical protein [Xanthobacter oligotrophicus]|uniref:hypothetical protein n=1 Tax=Xanthobacter oligotrophicus TaxID=2607286 RepID=UPI0011F3C75E|nr:hypothetical protein [Xanthobacter oligotrophicus]MCG5235542.1 hypothetical protein [Xanthobacter oligotrophicus]
MSQSLLTLFAPPEEGEYVGDFGMLCGFTASAGVLNRIAETFSGDGSRPRLAAFIHPTALAVTDVPGLAWMHFRLPLPFRLLHAKVALLGFCGPTDYLLRLAVSTGNWTAEPLTTSIDMFWCADLVVGARDLQLASDIRAADDLFGWLRERCNDDLLQQTFDGARPDERFREAIDRMPAEGRRPRFVDTRKETMRSQVLERLTKGSRRHLVIGSGYYEQGVSENTESLLESLHNQLVRERKLAKEDVALDLVLNEDSCQGLYECAEHLVGKGWKLRRPGSLHKEHSQAKLHAKYLYLAQFGRKGEIGRAQIYIGSGNFSRAGFESTAPHGNLEAGIVVSPDPTLSWRNNAKNSIRSFLPGDFASGVELAALAPGAAFDPPPDPPPPPPVAFVEWAGGEVRAPAACEVAVEVLGPADAPVELPCPWPAPPPAFVTLHPTGWKVPVRADGALVVPRRSAPTLEDILVLIGQFPAAPIGVGEEEEDGEGIDRVCKCEAFEAENNATRTYPIRQMMRLMTRLTEAQKNHDPRDWQRWCRELQQNLSDLAQTEPDMIRPFREAGANPLYALSDTEFLPAGVDRQRIEAAIRHITEAWDLSGAGNLWEHTP